jgi:protein SCO1/2
MKIIGKISLLLVASLLALNLQAAESEHAQHQHAAAGEDDPHAAHKAMMNKPAEPAESTRVDLLDHLLLDQHGREVKFVSDVIGDRIVVMDFVYTTCTTVCPVISAVFGQVQNKLGDRLGDDVVLVSVSVDPVRDTPQRLKAYSKIRLGAYSPNFEDHAAMVLIGDGQSGQWSRLYGFPNPDRIVEQVNALRAARDAVSGG